MADGYTFIAEQTAINNVSTFNFTSIPQTYQTLELWFRGHQFFSASSGGGDVNCSVEFKGSGTSGSYVDGGQAYYKQYLRGGEAASLEYTAYGATPGPYIPIGGNDAQDNNVAWKTTVMFKLRVFNYSSTTATNRLQWEAISCDGIYGTGQYARTGWDSVGSYRVTNVTDIQFTAPYSGGSGGRWKGQATLYGLS